MSKNRAWAILLIVLAFIGLLLISTPGLTKKEISSLPAYKACRQELINKEGYGVWTYKETKSTPFYAQILFSDGINLSFCRTIGVGPVWYVTMIGTTLASCELDWVSPQVKECPRGKFGVSP